MSKGSRKFLLKLSALCAPGIIIVIFYFIADPFQVIYKYKSYYRSGEPRYVTLNYDYVAIETFLTNYPIYKYNSIIIGNSRTRFYEMEKWKNYIHTNKCFHFDASSESLYGICKKFEFLRDHKVKIKNALIVIDYETLSFIDDMEKHLGMKHYILSGKNKYLWHLEFIKAFFSPGFLYPYIVFKLTGKRIKNIKDEYPLLNTPTEYDLKYNEMKFKVFEDMIEQDSSKFYTAEKMNYEFKRNGSTLQEYSPPIISKEQIVMLDKIRTILKQDSTNYKIIINPLYDQVKLNPKDLALLNLFFGSKNVFDFSGINEFTSDYHNYYEHSHYRPHVANQIMKEIYGKRN